LEYAQLDRLVGDRLLGQQHFLFARGDRLLDREGLGLGQLADVDTGLRDTQLLARERERLLANLQLLGRVRELPVALHDVAHHVAGGVLTLQLGNGAGGACLGAPAVAGLLAEAAQDGLEEGQRNLGVVFGALTNDRDAWCRGVFVLVELETVATLQVVVRGLEAESTSVGERLGDADVQ
jgi:hypothetical protein